MSTSITAFHNVEVLPLQPCSPTPTKGMTKLSSSPVMFAGGQASTVQYDSMPGLIKPHLLAMQKAHFPMMQSNTGVSVFEPFQR